MEGMEMITLQDEDEVLRQHSLVLYVELLSSKSLY